MAAIVCVSRTDFPFMPVLFVSIGRQPVDSLQIHWLDLIDVPFVSFPSRNPRGVATKYELSSTVLQRAQLVIL